jgi:hypothetical protein
MASAALIPFAFYQRLSPRERLLSLVVAGTVFVLVNLFAVSTLGSAFGTLRHDGAEAASDLQVQRLLASDQPKVAQRMDWLRKKQPVLVSRDRAGAALNDQVQQIARVGAVIVTNPRIRPPAPASEDDRTATPSYQAVSVEIETQSDWAGIKKFIQAVQQPENFLVFDLATLRSDTDPAVIRGRFQISKWYAAAR